MRIGVYGLGRFGSFWANVCRSWGEVSVYSRSQHPVPEGCTRVELEELCRVDALFLCSSISSMAEVSALLSPLLHDHTLVLDTCSVKSHPLACLESALRPTQAFLGTHPMFGPDSGKNGVAGLPIVLCPARATPEQESTWLENFSRSGMRVLRMSAEEHDREAARTQGITHLIGRLLSETGAHPSDIATLGYRKLLEVMEQTCNDPFQLFLDLQRYNPYSEAVRADFARALTGVEARLGAPVPLPRANYQERPDIDRPSGRWV